MTQLKDNNLKNVTGGRSSERSIAIAINLAEYQFDNKIDIKVYIDGELDRSLSRTIDSSITTYSLLVKGSGTKVLRIKFNDNIIKTYSLNFTNGTYIEL